MKYNDGIRRKQPLHGRGNLEPQHACICQGVALDLEAGGADSTRQTLDSQEILVRIFARNRREKGTVAGAEIYLERRAPPIDLL